MFRRRPIGKLVLYSLYSLALAGTFASLTCACGTGAGSAGLTACAGQSDVTPTFTPAPTQTATSTFTPTLDFLQLDRIPGLDPLAFNGGAGSPGEKLSLPQDVFAEARSRHLAPIEAEGGIASACAADGCTVMLTDVLVSGAKLQPATDGKVIYGFDGQAGSEALFRFSGLPEGVRATAFVSQDGNPWGFKPGTVVVWFWEGGSKGPATILNPDNPLQIIADKPNSISLTAIDNGLRITRTGPDGTVIDEQTVSFLSPLPEEFLTLEDWREVFRDITLGDYTIDVFNYSEYVVLTEPEQVRRLQVGTQLMILNPSGEITVFANPDEAAVRAEGGAVVIAEDRNEKRSSIDVAVTWAVNAAFRQYQQGNRNIYVRFGSYDTMSPAAGGETGISSQLNPYITDENGRKVCPWLEKPLYFLVEFPDGRVGQPEKFGATDPEYWLDELIRQGYGGIVIHPNQASYEFIAKFYDKFYP